MIPQGTFTAFAQCELIYSGRANATLGLGNYLIVYKADGTLGVHAGTKLLPRNYQGPGSKLTVEGNVLKSVNRKEIITITIHKLHWINEMTDWSDKETVVTKTERELVQKIVAHSDQYLGVPIHAVKTEYPTNVGPVDIFTEVASGSCQVVEVKRKRISLNDCMQLRKYVEYFMSKGRYPAAIIAGPSISKNAKKYCDDNQYEYLEVDFD